MPVDELSVKDKGKGEEKDGEKAKNPGDLPIPTTASPTNQSAAVTQ